VKHIVIVDIDGTVSKVGDRLKYLNQSPPDWDSFYGNCFEDDPIEEVIELVRAVKNYGYDIVFCTGRRESTRNMTRYWLHLNIDYWTVDCDLLMRPDGDKRHDTEVKPEQIKLAGIIKEDIAFIIEDRNSMVKKWRELGYVCLQPADGDF
jgi:hypothetical protein